MSPERERRRPGFFGRANNFEITPAELAERLRAGPPVAVVDCREDSELVRGRIESAEHVPLGQIPAQLDRIRTLAEVADVIVVCGHGHRSLHAARFLRNEGIANAWSLGGGMAAWQRGHGAGGA